MNKTAIETFNDNEVFLSKSKCSDLNCLYSLTPREVLAYVPWDVYPYWLMDDLMSLPTAGRFDGALAIIDGKLLVICKMSLHLTLQHLLYLHCIFFLT